MCSSQRTRRASPSRWRSLGQRVRGFTLMEMVVSIVLLSLVSITAHYFFADNLSLVRRVTDSLAGQADARALLERLSREVREVKFASSSFCISVMTQTQMRFNKTAGAGFVNTCGGLSPDNTKSDIAVEFGVANGVLSMGYFGDLSTPLNVSSPLASNVSNFAIRYLDKDLAVTTSASAIRYVELELTVQPAGAQATTARSLIALRNS